MSKHWHKDGWKSYRPKVPKRKEPIRDDELIGFEEPEIDWDAEERRVIQWYLNGGRDAEQWMSASGCETIL